MVSASSKIAALAQNLKRGDIDELGEPQG